MFSQDCHATSVRHSQDIRTIVAKLSYYEYAKMSLRQVRNTRMNCREIHSVINDVSLDLPSKI